MKWLKILEIKKDVPCRQYDITLGLYSKKPHIHMTDEPDDNEEFEIMRLIITETQLNALTKGDKNS